VSVDLPPLPGSGYIYVERSYCQRIGVLVFVDKNSSPGGWCCSSAKHVFERPLSCCGLYVMRLVDIWSSHLGSIVHIYLSIPSDRRNKTTLFLLVALGIG
jgi:hypothetical protein